MVEVSREAPGLIRKIFRFLAKANIKLKIGLAIFIAIALLGFLEPVINYYRLGGADPAEIGLDERFLPPSYKYPLGTDDFGRDIFGMLLIGIRLSLTIGILSAAIGIWIAIILGFVSGYKGGLIDHVLRSLIDSFLVIPTWPIFVIIAAYVQKIGLLEISLLLAIFGWAGAARAIRAQVLALKEKAYVQLAKVSGLKDIEIILFELLPNIMPYIIINFSGMIIGAIYAETGLRLIGLGPPTLPTLGYLINMYMTLGYLTARPLVILAVTIPLILIFVSLNLINVGLDEEFNPRLKKITGL